MSEDQETNVDANSREFKQGVEAGLNSEEDAKNWQPGYELGQELRPRETQDPVKEIIHTEADIPLFLADSSEGQKGDAQDEKDKTAE